MAHHTVTVEIPAIGSVTVRGSSVEELGAITNRGTLPSDPDELAGSAMGLRIITRHIVSPKLQRRDVARLSHADRDRLLAAIIHAHPETRALEERPHQPPFAEFLEAEGDVP